MSYNDTTATPNPFAWGQQASEEIGEDSDLRAQVFEQLRLARALRIADEVISEPVEIEAEFEEVSDPEPASPSPGLEVAGQIGRAIGQGIHQLLRFVGRLVNGMLLVALVLVALGVWGLSHTQLRRLDIPALFDRQIDNVVGAFDLPLVGEEIEAGQGISQAIERQLFMDIGMSEEAQRLSIDEQLELAHKEAIRLLREQGLLDTGVRNPGARVRLHPNGKIELINAEVYHLPHEQFLPSHP